MAKSALEPRPVQRRLQAVPAGRGGSAPSTGFPPRSLPSDEELIDAVERGDGSAASALYDRLFGVVDRTLVRLFGRRETDHDDRVQATFEQIIVTLSKRRYARACSLSTWASTLASHIGLNALRSRRRERNVVDRAAGPDAYDAAPASGDFERDMAAREQLERLRDELASIGAEKAEALFLHDVLGHELAEIAVMTGVSVAAAQSRLVRGRRELLERLRRAP